MAKTKRGGGGQPSWLKEFGVDKLGWPAESSDLNLRKHLWDKLECQLWARSFSSFTWPQNCHFGRIGTSSNRHCATRYRNMEAIIATLLNQFPWFYNGISNQLYTGVIARCRQTFFTQCKFSNLPSGLLGNLLDYTPKYVACIIRRAQVVKFLETLLTAITFWQFCEGMMCYQA